MVAYDSQAQVIKHFRVDKMVDIAVLEEERDGLMPPWKYEASYD